MAGKVLVNLTTGMEDPEQVTLAFLVSTAALEQGHEVVLWTTKEAVRPRPSGSRRGRGVRRLPAARAAVPAVPGVGRQALALPDLRQRPRPAGRREGPARRDPGRHADVAMGRRRDDGFSY